MMLMMVVCIHIHLCTFFSLFYYQYWFAYIPSLMRISNIRIIHITVRLESIWFALAGVSLWRVQLMKLVLVTICLVFETGKRAKIKWHFCFFPSYSFFQVIEFVHVCVDMCTSVSVFLIFIHRNKILDMSSPPLSSSSLWSSSVYICFLSWLTLSCTYNYKENQPTLMGVECLLIAVGHFEIIAYALVHHHPHLTIIFHVGMNWIFWQELANWGVVHDSVVWFDIVSIAECLSWHHPLHRVC